MQVAIIGAGYVGLVTAAGLAAAGNTVSILEISGRRLDALRAGRVPFHEPGLQEIVGRCLQAGTLRASGDGAEALAGAELVMICVGTPLDENGESDLSQVQSACQVIAGHAAGVPVVVRSTLPIGTTASLAAWLERDGLDELVTNPEFLRQGTAVHDFLHPTRIVVGSETGAETPAVQLIRSLYHGFDAPFLVTDYASAEMIKNAANAFLATKLSFINEVADLCEAYGADVDEVVRGMGLDPRIGSSYLRPGIGFGGSCLPKELANMVSLGQARALAMPLMTGAALTNDQRPSRIAERLSANIGGLDGARIAMLGLTFKPDTDDTRYSRSLALAEELLSRGASVVAHDPVLPADAPALPSGLERATDAASAIAGADLVVLATEWPEYRDLDWAGLAASARYPRVYDGRGVLDPDAMARAGWQLTRVGRASVDQAATAISGALTDPDAA
jgi:UDPglucose 6-dehydrogenase